MFRLCCTIWRLTLGRLKTSRDMSRSFQPFSSFRTLPLKNMFHLCRVCRSAAVKFSPETVRGSCHGKCRGISGEILRSSFLRKRSSKAPRIFHNRFHATFHETFCSCKCPISWHFSLCRRLFLTCWFSRRAENGQLDPSCLNFAFLGRPDVQSRGPKMLILKGFGASGRKIGAPQKAQKPTTTDPTPPFSALCCRSERG